MIYNPGKEIDVHRATERIKWFFREKKVFELKEKRLLRTAAQNRYLHLILSWFALEYGETLQYVKQELFKKQVSPQIFKTEHINRKTGEVREDWRSTADLDTKELTMAIDRFRDYSSKEAGIYLPQPDDLALMQEIEIQITNNSMYL